jgi:hypothetical protein
MTGLAGISGGYGLQGWMQAFDSAASSVSAAGDPTQAGPDLVDGMIGMHLAADGLKASIAAIHTADEMVGTVLDMLA